MFIVPELYPAVLYFSLLIVFFFASITSIQTNSELLLANSSRGSSLLTIIISISIIFFLGSRPIDDFFVDTVPYARAFDRIESMNARSFKMDVGFRNIMLLLSKVGFSANGFLLIVEMLYIGGITYVALKVFHRNSFIVLIAVFSTFFFYNYGVNTIRNGLAFSLIFVAMYFYSYREKKIVALVFSLLALSIHVSVFLLVLAYVLHILYPKTSHYLLFWMLCLILSFIVGRELEIIAVETGILDDWRSVTYLSGKHINMSVFSRIGYRWDFVLYSLPTVIWIWYWVIKRKVQFPFFLSISNVYLFSNALWLLVNQNWLSDRLVTLSWFFHAFIFMYPLLHARRVTHRRVLILFFIYGNLIFSIFYKVL